MAVPHPDRAFAFQTGTSVWACQDMEHVAEFGAARAYLAGHAAVLAVRTAVQGGGQ
jgi:hypothetical protein